MCYAIVIATIIGICLSRGVDAADPPQDSWGWFLANSAINKWFIETGKAKVVMSGTSFVAELYDSRNDELAVTLKGTIVRGRVNVIAIQLSTDAPNEKMTGVYKKWRWTNAQGGREAILLSVPDEPGGLTIGLTHELK